MGARDDEHQGSARRGYQPGYGADMLAMLAGRTVERRASFVLPHLRPGLDLLDVGCGPGTITIGLARRVAPGRVLGVDVEPSQTALATAAARSTGVARTTSFLTAPAEMLPVEDASVDVAFAHALLEHVPHPAAVLAELRRVLRPNGLLAVCSSDWSGAVLHPSPLALQAAVVAHVALRRRAGADPHVGARLVDLVREAGFENLTAQEQHHEDLSPPDMASYIAVRLLAACGSRDAATLAHAEALRTWAGTPRATFGMRWTAVTARRPDGAGG